MHRPYCSLETRRLGPKMIGLLAVSAFCVFPLQLCVVLCCTSIRKHTYMPATVRNQHTNVTALVPHHSHKHCPATVRNQHTNVTALMPHHSHKHCPATVRNQQTNVTALMPHHSHKHCLATVRNQHTNVTALVPHHSREHCPARATAGFLLTFTRFRSSPHVLLHN